ncbi:hypothetical protein SNE40_019262 [Patella caerulea]|uniref:Sulfotransferase domain-containing protein n=2 Tax=Patella caerulea TaxID=87958 RepID=A0AAN8J6U2_PATCE
MKSCVFVMCACFVLVAMANPVDKSLFQTIPTGKSLGHVPSRLELTSGHNPRHGRVLQRSDYYDSIPRGPLLVENGETKSVDSNEKAIYVDDDNQVLYLDPPEQAFTQSNRPHIDSSNNRKTSVTATKRLPQALIIGVKKGGTRALLEFLRIHPDVRAPGPEPHFFDRHYDKGLEWYRDQMPSTLEGQITIEKTPCYFVTKEVPQRIYNMSKDIKLIIVVRDPVTRAISDYTQAATKRPALKPFEKMAFIDNTSRIVDTKWAAVKIGVYAKHLEKWLKYFPIRQIHFVNGETLISNPAGEMAKVQDFLGLKRIVTDKHFYLKDSRGFPCLKKRPGSGRPHCLRNNKGRTHPHVDQTVLNRLRDFFKPFNLKFYQMTGINFGWS